MPWKARSVEKENCERQPHGLPAKDARRVEKQLSGDDKERFAQHLESFDALRKIEEKKAGMTDQVRNMAKANRCYDSTAPSARIESHFEIASAALIAGLTNVITLRPDTLGVKYWSCI